MPKLKQKPKKYYFNIHLTFILSLNKKTNTPNDANDTANSQSLSLKIFRKCKLNDASTIVFL